jgi:hypothetical protein
MKNFGWFSAGAIVMLLCVVVFWSACTSSAPGTSVGGWQIMRDGTTIVQTPCALVYIEVRSMPDSSTFFWRIAIVPIVKQIPEKKTPKTEV